MYKILKHCSIGREISETTGSDDRCRESRAGGSSRIGSRGKSFEISAGHPPDQQVFSLSPGVRVLLFTIILMSVGVAGGAGADLSPPDRADDGRGSYEMVDILAIANGWSTVALRETLQRDRAVQSPYNRCYENPSWSCAVLVSGARYIASEQARRHNEREYPPSALDHPRLVIPLLTSPPPRALNINRSAAERSAARGASRSPLHLTSTADSRRRIRAGSPTSTITGRGANRRPRRETASFPISRE